MPKKYSCYILIFLLCISIFTPQVANAEENYDIKVESYDEFYLAIKESMSNFDRKVSIRIEGYDSEIYDYSESIEKILVENPEIYYSYGGASASLRSYYSYQTYRIIDLHFRYSSTKEDMEKLKETQEYIDFKKIIANGLNSFENKMLIKINKYDESKYNVDNVISVILSEIPDIDYGIIGWSYSIYGEGQNKILELYINYSYSKDKMIEMKEAVDKKAKEIIAKVIKPGMNDFEKELALHDYVINNAKYNTDYEENKILPEHQHTAYGVLIEGKGVCSSYAMAMHKLLDMVGIENYYITGTGNGQPHAWNIVKIQGNYYHLDATWNDTIYGEGNISHKYFNLTDSQFSEDHTWEKKDYPQCINTLYSYDNISKILSGEIEFLSSEDSQGVESIKNLPNNTLVIGNKAFDIEFANNPNNKYIIYNEMYRDGEVSIYVKFNNKWFNINGSGANIQDISDVSYTSDGFKYKKYNAIKSTLFKDKKDDILINLENLIAGSNIGIEIEVNGVEDYPKAERFSLQSSDNIVEIGQELFVFPGKKIGDIVKVQLYSSNNEILDVINVAIEKNIFPPKNLKTVSVSQNEVDINWDEVEKADHYYVYESSSIDGEYIAYTDENSDKKPYYWYSDYSLRIYDIDPNTTLYFKVTSVKDGIESEFSEVLSATTTSDMSKAALDVVREGSIEKYEEYVIEDTFNNYFEDPEWRYFQSTDGYHVVEFKGISYDDYDLVEILIQFTVDIEENTFYINYKEKDGESMGDYDFEKLLEEIYYKIK